MTPVLRVAGRSTPCKFLKRPHALQSGRPSLSRRQRGVFCERKDVDQQTNSHPKTDGTHSRAAVQASRNRLVARLGSRVRIRLRRQRLLVHRRCRGRHPERVGPRMNARRRRRGRLALGVVPRRDEVRRAGGAHANAQRRLERLERRRKLVPLAARRRGRPVPRRLVPAARTRAPRRSVGFVRRLGLEVVEELRGVDVHRRVLLDEASGGEVGGGVGGRRVVRVEVVEEEGTGLGRSAKVGRRGVDEALVDGGRGRVGVGGSRRVALAWGRRVAGFGEDVRGSSEAESRGGGGGEGEGASGLGEVRGVDVGTRRDVSRERGADAGRMPELQNPSVPLDRKKR